MKSRIKTAEEFRDAKLRIFYESRYGKDIRLCQWRCIKDLLESVDLEVNEDNLSFIAIAKKNNPKVKHNSKFVQKLNAVRKIIIEENKKVRGWELREAAIKSAKQFTGNTPKDSTIYGWFRCDDVGGYKELQEYTLEQVLVVMSKAICYEPRVKKDIKQLVEVG